MSLEDFQSSQELLGFVSQLAGDQYLKVEEHLGDGFFRLNIAEAEKRQAKHDIRWVEDIVVELVRNSIDAGSTKIFISSQKSGDRNRELVVIDNGAGIPPALHQKVFESRVTSKLDNVTIDKYGIHGRGMALFSISSRAKVAYVVSSELKKGTVIKIKVDTSELPERKDQSTYPKIGFRQGEPVLLRGPHNVIWFLSDFSFSYQKIDFYLGSPAEIASTVYHLGGSLKQERSSLKEMRESADFCIWQYLTAASNPREFIETARDFLGLDISERNAYRIIQREIEPLAPLKIRLGLGDKSDRSEKKPGLKSQKSGLARYFNQEDLNKLCRSTANSAAEIAKKYFMHLRDEPRIIKSGDRIKIIFTLEADEEV